MLVRGESSSTKSRNDFLKRESRLSRMDGESFYSMGIRLLGKKNMSPALKFPPGIYSKMFEQLRWRLSKKTG